MGDTITTSEDWYNSEFRDISLLIKDKDSLNLSDFLRMRNFKLNNHSTEKNDNIIAKTKKSFYLCKQNDIKTALKTLMMLNGVGLPVASAILAFKFPNKVVIIDKNVISALKQEKKIDTNTYNLWIKKYTKDESIYPEFLEKVKACKIKTDKDLRDTEFRLFKKGKQKHILY